VLGFLDNPTTFDYSSHYQYDIFYVMNLTLGENNITLRIINESGLEWNYTKTIIYDPLHSTEHDELLYVNSRYRENNERLDGILVIDLRRNIFLGIIKDNYIYGITGDSKEIILNSGERYSTTTNNYTGITLPIFYHECELLFTNDGKYLYHDYSKIDLATNTEEELQLPENVCYYADITDDDSRIYFRYGYIDLATNEYTEKTYDRGYEFRVSPAKKYIFTNYYRAAHGYLRIEDSETGLRLKEYRAGDYSGDVVFSKDKKKTYAGFYGNTYYGYGGILIIDLETLNIDNEYPLHGARSLAVSDENKIFSSAFYTHRGGRWRGTPERRGIIQFNSTDDGKDLTIEKVYFVNLWSSFNEPYYSNNNIYYKSGSERYECYIPSDCGKEDWIGNAFCQGNDLYQNFTNNTCMNPGTPSSYCVITQKPAFKHKCVFGCSDSDCNKKPTSTGNIKIIGRDLLVNNKRYRVKSVGYSPVPIGESADSGYDITIHPELWARDFPLLREMNANIIRTWGEVNSRDFLDAAWNNGNNPLRVIMGYWMDPRRDYKDEATRQMLIDDFKAYVNRYKDHPAVLVWAIGNEENYFYGGSDPEKHAAYFSLVNEMAKETYNIEKPDYHPVMAISLEMPGEFKTVGYAEGGSDDATIPYVDIWGLNNYPTYGTYGDYFDRYLTKTSKPLIITEYGVDALNNTAGVEYEETQAEWNLRLWKEINDSHVIGGSFMEYCDEWWKSGSASTHNNGGYSTNSHPDHYSNEEWWGIIRTVDNGSYPDIMQPRQVYYSLMEVWKEKEITLNISKGWNLFSPIFGEAKQENISINLTQGWNLFGYSANKPFLWRNALIKKQGYPDKTIVEAASAGWIQSTIYYYEDEYKFVPYHDSQLRKNKGYWLHALEDNLALIIPNVDGYVQENSMPWSSVLVTNGSETKPVLEARDWLQTTIYAYDQGYKFIPGDDDYIYPWKGYWVYANKNITLNIE